jgi:hypothetical protein
MPKKKDPDRTQRIFQEIAKRQKEMFEELPSMYKDLQDLRDAIDRMDKQLFGKAQPSTRAGEQT